jgi:hypothetical protein
MTLCLLACGLCCGLNCLPFTNNDPAQNPQVDSVSPDNTTPPTDQNQQGETPDTSGSAGCHSGTFQCSDGPGWYECGSWSFDINAGDSVVGEGQIHLPGGQAPVAVTLTGVVDPTADSLDITLTTAGDGQGAMHASNVGPTLELTGGWSFTRGPEVGGDEIEGEVAGSSCESLP